MLESSSLADLSNVGDNPSGPGDPDFCFLMACSTIDSQKISGLGVDESRELYAIYFLSIFFSFVSRIS